MTTPTNVTLTDRYLDAVLRRVPGRRRIDLDRELRASIADAIDDRVEAGEEWAEAERAVLTELGDPVRLAAGYADRPLHLVGPALFPDYLRLLTTLLALVVPIVAAVVAISRAYHGDAISSIIAATVGAGITTFVHVACWTTLLFAVLERLPIEHRPPSRQWTPAALPEPPSRRARYTELITVTVAVVLFSAAILLSPLFSPASDAAGNPIGLLTPWLWETGIVYVYIGLVIFSLGNAFAKYYGPKHLLVVLIGTLADVAPAIALIWLATSDRVLNPAFVAAVGWTPELLRWIELGFVIAAAVSILSSIAQAAARIRTR